MEVANVGWQLSFGFAAMEDRYVVAKLVESPHDGRPDEARPTNHKHSHEIKLTPPHTRMPNWLRLPASAGAAIVGVKPSMSVEQLGKALTQARTARGLTLPDVERDTRISSKYLEALERGELETLPAPVYARAFMRTYSQYLGLNARDFVSEMPGARPEPELPPLPDVTREGHMPLVSPSWAIAGATVIVLVIAGMFMFWNRSDDSSPSVVTNGPQAERPVGEGSDNPQSTASTQPVDVQAGEVPDVRGRPALVGIHAISEAGLRFFIVGVKNDNVDHETIFQQSPSPGTSVDDGAVVTLMISK